MREFLLDTNHLGAAINPVSHLRDRLYRERQAGVRFRTCVPVLCELEAGIQESPRVDAFRRQLTHLLRKVKLVPLDQDFARRFGEVYGELRRQGRALSQVDMMLAALARQHKLTLLTSDRDFQALPDLHTEDWLV